MNQIDEVLKGLGMEDAYVEDGNIMEDFHQIQFISRNTPAKQVVVRSIETDAPYISILPISDIHMGAKYCDEKQFDRFVEFISSSPNIYTVLMGDLMESATRTSVGLGMYDEKYSLTEQKRVLHEKLKPLADNGKILGAVTGNHEMRPQYFNNNNPMQELCYYMGVPELYLGYQGYIRLKVNDVVYDAMIFHGSGGGTTKGGKVNAASRPNQIAEVDIYFTGHTHDQIYLRDKIYRINEQDEIEEKIRHYVVCGSFLEYFGGYAEMKGLAPSVTGAPLLHLYTDKKAIHCTM